MNQNDGRMRVAWCCLAITALGFSAAQAAEPVSIESLLNEMTDRDSVAHFPETDFRRMQHSSYSRESKTPDDPEAWFKNKDYNKSPQGKNFIRIEENQGQREWALMDHEGPGTLVRTWMPWRRHQNSTSDTRIRIYLDGAFTLRAEVVGKNAMSAKTGTYFGLDCVVIRKEMENTAPHGGE